MLAAMALFGANASKMEVSPVQKVIQLLQGMLEKGKKEKNDEQKLFAASRQFCDDEEDKKVIAIKGEGETIERLTTMIAKDSADAETLLRKIGFLDKDRDIWSGDIKAATKVREIERADYEKKHADYTESIDAVGRAVTVLKKETGDHNQKPSLIQLSTLKKSSLIPDEAKKTLDSFPGGRRRAEL